MKFIYVDESGAAGDSDVFVMCGLMVDAYKLRKKTADFDKMLAEFLAKHPGSSTELKTSRFINGKGGWSKIAADERKAFLTDICKLAVANGGKLFGIGLSFPALNAARAAGHGHPFGESYWLAGGMFTCALVQKKMQSVKNSKGLTVVIMDDNKVEMPQLSDGLYDANAWYDGLYQLRGTKRGKKIWLPRSKSDRFDHIINTAFAIKSHHSSLVQVADAICYVYRRHLEMKSSGGAYPGEGVKLIRGFIVVQTHRPTRPEVTRELVEAWYRDRAHIKFPERIELCLGLFPDPEAFRPKGLIVRQTRQRWGSMSPAGRLLLNRRLVQAPVDAIDYVITHELCHVAEPHHGAAFFDLLETVMPDWERRKQRLERAMA